MKHLKIGKVKKSSNAHMKFSEVEMKLPSGGDCDVRLALPNGQEIVLQYRRESPSIDICLPFNAAVINWKGTDLKSAPPVHKQAHVRLSG